MAFAPFQRIFFRRDTSIRWTAINPVLGTGEPAYETDTGKQKIGDGKRPYKDLPYALESGPQGPPGPQGIQGSPGPQGARGLQGFEGPIGPAGPANSLTIGTVTSGVTAQASFSGTVPSQQLNLVLPRGEKGDAGQPCSLSVGTVTRGTVPSATITGTAPLQILNLILPQGDQGQAGSQGIQGIQGPVGPKGDTGPRGAGVVVQGVISTWPPTASPADGDLWILGSVTPVGTPSGAVSGDGFVYDGTARTWFNIGQMRGPQGLKGDIGPVGPQGPQGPSASLAIGSVSAGTNPGATITGTAPSQVLNLILPRGDTGPQGPQGAVGPAGPQGIAGPSASLTVGTVASGAPLSNPSVSITGSSPNQTISFVIPRGEPGPVGPSGTYVAGVLKLEDGVALNDTHLGQLFWFTKKAPSPSLTNNIGISKATHDAAPIGAQITIIHDMPEAGANVSITSGSPNDFQVGWLGETVPPNTPVPVQINNRYSSVRLYKLSSTRWVAVGDVTAISLQFTTNPVNRAVIEGESVTFTAAAQSTSGTVIYKWQQSTNQGTTWTDIPGATNATYTFTPTLSQNGAWFRCVASSSSAQVTSMVATLAVTSKPPADGTNWILGPSNSALGRASVGVNFNNGLFITGGSIGPGHWSSDGIDWALSPTAATNTTGVGVPPVFGNGTFLTCGALSGGGLFQTSSDGKNWVTRARPYAGTGSPTIGFGFGRFVAFFRNANTGGLALPYHSVDGINWTAGPAITGMALTIINSIAMGGGNANLLVAVGSSATGATTQYLVSADGITWVTKTLPVAADLEDIAYGNNSFMAVGTGLLAFYNDPPATAATTTSFAMKSVTMPTSASWSAVAHGNGLFMALGASSATAAITRNLTTWELRTLPVSAAWVGLAFGNGRFVATSTTAVATST